MPVNSSITYDQFRKIIKMLKLSLQHTLETTATNKSIHPNGPSIEQWMPRTEAASPLPQRRPQRPSQRPPQLRARWIVEEGKLVCQWFTPNK